MDPALLRDGSLLFLCLVVSISIHEWAHAFAADRLGDPTPRSQDRVTLNPLSHLDWIGTVLIPLVNIFIFQGKVALIGWGKPVQINPSYFRHKVRDDLITTLAGPGSNLVLALAAAVVGGIAFRFDPRTAELFVLFMLMNVGLIVFNLLPLPPLDGGRVFRHLIGMSEETFIRISLYSPFILLIAINLGPVRTALSHLINLAATPFFAIYLTLAGA